MSQTSSWANDLIGKDMVYYNLLVRRIVVYRSLLLPLYTPSGHLIVKKIHRRILILTGLNETLSSFVSYL